MRYWYEGEIRGMDLNGFGRLFYYNEAESAYRMFTGFVNVEHYDHNQRVDDRKTNGGNGIFMKESGFTADSKLTLTYSGIYRQNQDFDDVNGGCRSENFGSFSSSASCF
jgi:hypothetical protein